MPGKGHLRAVRGICAVVGLWLVFAYPSPGYGQGNIRVGDLRVHPFIELSGEWNDNISLSPRDEIDDFIWILSPGVTLELPGRQLSLRLGYRADILRYQDQDQLNETHHTLQGDARFNFTGGLSLYVSDEFKRTSDFAGFPVPELTSRILRNENLFRAGAEYTLRERIGLALDYSFFLVDYRDEPVFDEFDREDHQIGATLFFRILPKTSILGEYQFQAVRYDIDEVARDRDSDSNKFKVGLKGDLTEKTSVLVKVGAEFKDYDNPARDDWDGLILEAEALHKYQEGSQIRLFASRANFESTFEQNNFYVSTYGGVEVRHQIRPRLLLKLAGLVGRNEYPEETALAGETKERRDNFYEVGVALRYQIRTWLAVEGSYDHLVRDSNFADFDYTNNRVRGTISLTF